MENLIQLAELRYKDASKIVSPHSGNTFHISENGFKVITNEVGVQLKLIDSNDMPYVYYDNRWAEIVEYRESKEPVINNNYNIF